MSNNTQINMAGGMLIIEAVHSNPNGDPNGDNYPRTVSNQIGIISDVSVKKKIRNMIMKKEGSMWKHVQSKFGLDTKRFNILEDPDLKLTDKQQKAKKSDKLADEYWDARVFGYCILSGDTGRYTRTGCTVFGYGRSVAPINMITHTITKQTPVQDKRESGMGTRHIVEHGIYYMPFFIDANDAKRTSCSREDIEVLLELLPYVYKLDKSVARPEVNIKHAFYWEWKSPLGGNDCDLMNSLKPIKVKDTNVPSISSDEYEFPTLNNKVFQAYKDKLIKAVDLVDLC